MAEGMPEAGESDQELFVSIHLHCVYDVAQGMSTGCSPLTSDPYEFSKRKRRITITKIKNFFMVNHSRKIFGVSMYSSVTGQKR